MRNFGEEQFFRKQLFIAGRFDKTLDALGAETAQAKHEGLPENTGLVSHPDDKKVPGYIEDGSPLTIKMEKTICQKGERLKFKINKSKRSLLSIFPDKKKEIAAAFRKNKAYFRNDYDLIRAVGIIDSLE